MVVVNSGIMQDKIKSIVENYKDYEFTYVKKEGIQLFFEVNTSDEEAAAAAAKKAIKADSVGKTLLVSVSVR